MYSNILVPVMLGEGQEYQESFRVAESLASPGARFTLLHVMEPLPSFVEAEVHSDVLADAGVEIRAELSRKATSLAHAEVRVISGRAGQSIVTYADQDGTDCIIIASHHPGLSNYFLGSTASRVVRHANCSVHVLR